MTAGEVVGLGEVILTGALVLTSVLFDTKDFSVNETSRPKSASVKRYVLPKAFGIGKPSLSHCFE